VETDVVALVVSELATNSVNVRSWFKVSVYPPYEDGTSRYLQIRVADGKPALSRPSLTMPAPEDLTENGRGLSMVELVAERWYWAPMGDGKYVSVTLREKLSGHSRSRPAVIRSTAAV
jgi:anti-sigma regulatory factor (Ser/Thr protein kinase)